MVKGKKKSRKGVVAVVILILSAFIAGSIGWIIVEKKESLNNEGGIITPVPEPSEDLPPTTEEKPSVTPPVEVFPTLEPETYTITYRLIEDGVEKDVYEFLWQDGEEYPTSYREGEFFAFANLNGATEYYPDPTNVNKDYSFKGWYLDKECKTALANTRIVSGDVTLYGKVTVGYWIGPY